MWGIGWNRRPGIWGITGRCFYQFVAILLGDTSNWTLHVIFMYLDVVSQDINDILHGFFTRSFPRLMFWWNIISWLVIHVILAALKKNQFITFSSLNPWLKQHGLEASHLALLYTYLLTNDLFTSLKYTLFSLRDYENLLKDIIVLLNEMWRKRNLSAHGRRIPSPQDIIGDCNSTISFSLLAL